LLFAFAGEREKGLAAAAMLLGLDSKKSVNSFDSEVRQAFFGYPTFADPTFADYMLFMNTNSRTNRDSKFLLDLLDCPNC
jgi:hypothetical protein